MALLERVSTLLRANINDLLAKAEDPEKLARQLILDMENQLMQVKTQVAIAIADQHLLKKKREEQEAERAEWVRRAELALGRQEEGLARGALERSLTHQRMAEGLAQQLSDQTAETDTLRAAYTRLEQKLTETRQRVELLTAQLRRGRSALQAGALDGSGPGDALRRLAEQAGEAEARGVAARTLLAVATAESLDERFRAMEQSDEVEALLLELKERQPRLE